MNAMTHPRYTRTARALHWLVALAIAAAFLIAAEFDGLPLTPHKIHLINYHKWVGLTVLWLAIVRMLWRVAHRPPELPPRLHAWEHEAAHAAHAGLYVLMFATPLMGWWLSCAMGFAPNYLGWIRLPSLGAKDKILAELLEPLHVACAWSLVTLACLHATAAVRHHFVHHDGILHRMI